MPMFHIFDTGKMQDVRKGGDETQGRIPINNIYIEREREIFIYDATREV
jgi:hypothetical protein